MDWLVVSFRLLHVLSAIAWAGGAAVFTFFIEPTLTELGPDAEKFADELLNTRRIPIYFAIVSTFAVVGGIGLYYHDAGGLQLWTSPTGTVFSIGAVAGILGWLGGNSLIAPATRKVMEVGAEIKAAGGPPSAELQARLHAAQQRLHNVGLADFLLIAIAAICMSTARYFV